jgi:hypothetical protein
MLWINPSLADLAALSTYVAQIITTGEGVHPDPQQRRVRDEENDQNR